MTKKLILSLALISSILISQAKEFNIKTYGAKPNENSTEAIQKAIDTCNEWGGGTVLVPSGKYIIGTIKLKSYVNLHLEQGAVLQASLNLDDYLTTFRIHGMILCEDAEQVSITGLGTIHARGIDFYDPSQNHTYDEFDKKYTRQKEGYMPKGKFYSDGPIKRKPKPGMTVTFYHCSHVRIQDITIKDTPDWAIRLGYCEDVNVDGITILNNLMIPNSDGVHCTVSRNVRITDCNIIAGDDAIIVTGFPLEFETPAYNMEHVKNRPFGNKSIYSENYVVGNCNLRSRSSGIRVGYGQHPTRNCVFSNINIYGSNRGIGVFAHDSVNIENLVFSNFTIETKLHNGQWWGNGEPIHISIIPRFEGIVAGEVKNVQFNNIIAKGDQGILLYGLEESKMHDISFRNVQLKITKGKETMDYGGNIDLRPTVVEDKMLFEHDIPGIYAQFVEGLTIEDFKLTWDDDLPTFFTYPVQCVSVNNLEIDDFEGSCNPNFMDSDGFKLENTTLKE